MTDQNSASVVPCLHTRTPSYGKKLAKFGKTGSVQNLQDDATRHKKVKSTASIASLNEKYPKSPKSQGHKRDSVAPAVLRNSSHLFLRKNKSSTILSRNTSRNFSRRKLALATSAPRAEKDHPEELKGFELGEGSSEDDGNEEWVDSATHSPKVTRSNSAKSTQPEVVDGVKKSNAKSSVYFFPNDGEVSPPELPLRLNRSAPNFFAINPPGSTAQPPRHPLALPQQQERPKTSGLPSLALSSSIRAPEDAFQPHPPSAVPAKLFNHVSPNEGTHIGTPDTGKIGANSASIDGGVSRFLPEERQVSQRIRNSLSPRSPIHLADGSVSPETSHPSTLLASVPPDTNAKTKKGQWSAKIPPSRTQQRLDLQRRETMRTSAPTTPTTPLLPDGHRGSFGAPLRHMSNARGQSRGHDVVRSDAASITVKQDYDLAEAHLDVVRRFRNPVIEAIGRLKERKLLNLGPEFEPAPKKPPNRRSWGLKSDLNLAARAPTNKTMKVEDINDHSSHLSHPDETSTNGTQSRGNSALFAEMSGTRRFRRQGSHDDIGLSRSQGSSDRIYDGQEEDNGLPGSAKVAGGSQMAVDAQMMRRIWESREVYETTEDTR